MTIKPINILRFNDIDNIEYRKGSKKFGGLLVKLMEFLRIHKNENNKIINNVLYVSFLKNKLIDIQIKGVLAI